MKTKNMTTPDLRKLIGCWSVRLAFLHIPLALACFGLAPMVQAVGPDTEGAIAGANNGEGIGVLVNRTSGVWNTGTGYEALNNLTTGGVNTATGLRALFSNTVGFNNTATGVYSLYSNVEGAANTADGWQALVGNTTGIGNVAMGARALANNTSGAGNTAVGTSALERSTSFFNTAVGTDALSQTIGGFNTAVGSFALYGNVTGSDNTAIGDTAGDSITGSGNVCIGAFVFGEGGVDDSTYIRNVNTLTQNFSAGVNDYVTVRLSDGRLGHTAVVSSQRYKEDIKPLAKTSQSLYALKPVSFRLKKEFDPTQALGFGLIAEEVEHVDPALVYRNDKGQVESVRYEMVNAMLLNEFLKEHRKVEELEGIVTSLAATVKEQTAQIKKVSARLEASKPAPQIVRNNQ
jgi:hypothetical protein